MKVLQETPSLCLVWDPYFEFSEFWGTCKKPPDPHTTTLTPNPLSRAELCVYTYCWCWQVFLVGHSQRWRLTSCCLNYQTDVLLICRKNVLLHRVFFLFFLFLLNIFSFCRWYLRRRYLSGVQVCSCVFPLILPINLTCTWETIY